MGCLMSARSVAALVTCPLHRPLASIEGAWLTERSPYHKMWQQAVCKGGSGDKRHRATGLASASLSVPLPEMLTDRAHHRSCDLGLPLGLHHDPLVLCVADVTELDQHSRRIGLP